MRASATCSDTRRPRRGGGFTVIELIAVIVILAVLSAVALPAMSNLENTRGGMAGKQLLRDLTFARQYAVATGTTTWVVFDTAAETWSILIEDPGSPGRVGATAYVDPATSSNHLQTLNAGSFVGIEILTAAFDGNVEVGFDWLGQPRNAAETALAAVGTVTLTGNHQVSVTDGTGHSTYTKP